MYNKFDKKSSEIQSQLQVYKVQVQTIKRKKNWAKKSMKINCFYKPVLSK